MPSIAEILKGARQPDQHVAVVYDITGKLCSKEDAGMLLAYLAIFTFGVSESSDIVLYSWGLLDGIDSDLPIMERRWEYLKQSQSKRKFSALNRAEENRYVKIENRIKAPGEEKEALFSKALKKENRIRIPCIPSYRKKQETPTIAVAPADTPLLADNDDNPPALQTLSLRGINFGLKNPAFIEREDIFKQIAKNFKKEKNLQLIYGMAGVGKTQIAKQYAYAHQFAYGITAWIDASNPESIRESCANILQRIGYHYESDIRIAFLSCFEQRNDWLLIYDNADYLDDDSEEAGKAKKLLESYLPKNDGHILITTRCNKDFMGAVRIPVNVFTPELASRLLVEVSGFEINNDVNKLAEQLGYLPLALQYAAAYIREYCSSYREYLELWEEEGIPLFDQDDGDLAERTVRKAFHITLDKLRDDIVAVDFLHRLASLNVNALPLRHYLEVVEEQPEKTRYYDHVYYDPVYGCEMVRMLDSQNKIRQYRIEKKMGNGYMRLSNIPFPKDSVQEPASETIDARVIDADYLHPALKDKISRNKLIQKLKSCSLIEWDKTNVYTHPLLREIIFDEMTVQEKFKWYSEFFTPLLVMSVYRKAGNKDAARELLFRSICIKLGLKKVDGSKEAESLIRVGDDCFERVENHFMLGPELDSLFLDVLSLNDADFTKEFFKLRHELERQGYISRFPGCSTHDIVCEQLAVMLNCDIAYRSYQAPKQRTKGDKKYFVGFAHRSKCTGVMETPVEETICEAARAAIDIWLTDIEEDDEERWQKLQGLIADEDADWWIIALPLGDAYFLDKNDL